MERLNSAVQAAAIVPSLIFSVGVSALVRSGLAPMMPFQTSTTPTVGRSRAGERETTRRSTDRQRHEFLSDKGECDEKGQLKFRPGFRLSVANSKSQAAVMVLPVGGKEGGSDNLHKGADQWLFVVDGSGVAIVNGRKMPLKTGTIVLIEAGDRDEIRNTGRASIEDGQRLRSARVSR